MKIIFIFLFLFLYSCDKIKTTTINKNNNDTIAIETTVPDEVATFPNEKKYFIAVNKEILEIFCTFDKINDNEISLQVDYFDNRTLLSDSSAVGKKNDRISSHKISYEEQMKLLCKIFEKADTKYNLSNMHSIIFGELINNGDLAVEVTNVYYKRYGKEALCDYKYIEQIIENSSLKKYLNDALKPYSLSVDTINIEKAFFVSKTKLFETKKIKYPPSEIPEKILNCSIYVTLSHKE